MSSAELLTQPKKGIRALTHTFIYDCFGWYVCYCTYKFSPIAFNDDPSRKLATKAIVPTRKPRRTMVPVSATAKCTSVTSVRLTSTATPMVTRAISLHPGEFEITDTNTMRAIKLIKNAERKVPQTRSQIKAAARRDRSSQGVRSWVVEFKKTRQGETLIAFDSLFKDALLP
jgi:hypothetical protein